MAGNHRRVLIVGLMLAGLICLRSTSLVASHPYHVSSAEIRWNEATGNFEVALCVWPADLERAIANQSNSTADLNRIVDLDAALQQYVAGRFFIRPMLSAADTTTDSAATSIDAIKTSRKTVEEIRWVGHEIDAKQAWLYFEIPGDQQVGKWRIDNRVFFELNEDQLNQVQLSCTNSVASVALTHNNPTYDFVTEKKSRSIGWK